MQGSITANVVTQNKNKPVSEFTIDIEYFSLHLPLTTDLISLHLTL